MAGRRPISGGGGRTKENNLQKALGTVPGDLNIGSIIISKISNICTEKHFGKGPGMQRPWGEILHPKQISAGRGKYWRGGPGRGGLESVCVFPPELQAVSARGPSMCYIALPAW